MNGDQVIKDNLCRDFLRNVCSRGSNCKFRHPEGDEAKSAGKRDLIFCHDFQNKECRRTNCKFVHCTKQEEEIYRATGYIPEHVVEGANQGRNGTQVWHNIPICKDFLKSECKRGNRCKFRHIPPLSSPIENGTAQNRFQQILDIPAISQHSMEAFRLCDALPKATPVYEDLQQFQQQFHQESYQNSHQVFPEQFRILQDENGRLLHKIEELKKQVMELTANNQFLRDQNDQYRSLLASKDWYVPAYQNSYLPL